MHVTCSIVNDCLLVIEGCKLSKAWGNVWMF